LVSRILVSDKPCQPAHRFERRSLRIGPGCVVSRWEGRIEIERPGRGSGAGVLRACLRSPDSCTRPDRSPEIIVRLPGATAQLDMAPSPAKAAISSMRLSPLPVWTEMTIFSAKNTLRRKCQVPSSSLDRSGSRVWILYGSSD